MISYSQKVPVHAVKTKEMNSLGFGIINLFDKVGKAYDSSVPHRHTFFELLVFIKAKGTHEIDFSHYPVENNSVHFVLPGQIHKLNLKLNQGYVLCFTEDFISLESKGRFVEKFPFFNTNGTPLIKLPKALCEELETIILTMHRETELSGANSLDICRSYLTILLLKLKNHFSKIPNNVAEETNDKNQKVSQFKTLINDNYLSHKTVSEYADDLCVSPNHLNALCKRQEGKTATQLIQERMLLESKRLLYATDMHIKEISFYLQFEDVPYFNRFFKKLTRLTPNDYRQLIQKKR